MKQADEAEEGDNKLRVDVIQKPLCSVENNRVDLKPSISASCSWYLTKFKGYEVKNVIKAQYLELVSMQTGERGEPGVIYSVLI